MKENSPQEKNPLKVHVDKAIKILRSCLEDGSNLAKEIAETDQQLRGNTKEIFDIGPLQKKHRLWQDRAVSGFRDVYHDQYYERRFLNEYNVDEGTQKQTYDEFINGSHILDKLQQNRNEAISRRRKIEIAFEEKFTEKIKEKDIEELLKEHGGDGDFIARNIEKIIISKSIEKTNPIDVVKNVLRDESLRSYEGKNGEKYIVQPISYLNEQDIINSEWTAELGNKLGNLKSSLDNGIKFVKARVVFLEVFGSDLRLIRLEPLIDSTLRRILTKLKNVYSNSITISETGKALDYFDDLYWKTHEEERTFALAKEELAAEEYPQGLSIIINPRGLERDGFISLRKAIVKIRDNFGREFLDIFGFGPEIVNEEWLNKPPAHEYSGENICYKILGDYIGDFINDLKSLPYQVKKCLETLRLAYEKDQAPLESADAKKTLNSNHTQRKSLKDNPDIIEKALAVYIEDYKNILTPRIYEYIRDSKAEKLQKMFRSPAAQTDFQAAVKPIDIDQYVKEYVEKIPRFRSNENEPLYPSDYQVMRESIERKNAEAVEYINRNIPGAPRVHIQGIEESMYNLNNPVFEPYRPPKSIGGIVRPVEKVCDSETRESLSSTVSGVINHLELIKKWYMDNRDGKAAVPSWDDSAEIGKQIESINVGAVNVLKEETKKTEEPKELHQESPEAENIFCRSNAGFNIWYKGSNISSGRDLIGLFYIWACLDHLLKSISEKDLIKTRTEYFRDQSDSLKPYEEKYLKNISGGGIKDPKSVQKSYENYTTEIANMEADKKRALEENNNVEVDSLEQDIRKVKSERAKLRTKDGKPVAIIDDLRESRRKIYGALDYLYKVMESKQPEFVRHFRNHLIRERGLQYTGKLKWKTK